VTLTAADVAEIMRLVEESSFDELILEVDGLKLSLRRGAGVESASAQAPSDSVSAEASASEPTHPLANPTRSSMPARVDPNVHEVASPLLGTFYRAPKPGASAFVEVGSAVEEDTIVAIIEVMKLMNTVRAGVRGTVTEILARDGVLVEYDETLLRVSKAQ
jgi:acetyl-CoA carboxylase biotin carboxyl carrier protein